MNNKCINCVEEFKNKDDLCCICYLKSNYLYQPPSEIPSYKELYDTCEDKILKVKQNITNCQRELNEEEFKTFMMCLESKTWYISVFELNDLIHNFSKTRIRFNIEQARSISKYLKSKDNDTVKHKFILFANIWRHWKIRKDDCPVGYKLI